MPLLDLAATDAEQASIVESAIRDLYHAVADMKGDELGHFIDIACFILSCMRENDSRIPAERTDEPLSMVPIVEAFIKITMPLMARASQAETRFLMARILEKIVGSIEARLRSEYIKLLMIQP